VLKQAAREEGAGSETARLMKRVGGFNAIENASGGN
jgi:hypothetical protein